MKNFPISHTGSILSAIGKTPIVRLNNVVPANAADVYVKLEYFNPTGSYKDRMAKAIIEKAEAENLINESTTVIECTAGGTGNSLALVCKAKGYPFKVITSDAFAPEKLKSMKVLGATLDVIKSKTGQITPDLIPGLIAYTEKLAAQDGFYWPRQFNNENALNGYRDMAVEIINQLEGDIDAFVASVGTAGMFVGVTNELRRNNKISKGIIVEPETAPLISKGIKGTHKIDGIGVGFVPPLLALGKYDDVITIEESDARAMARRLAAEEGIFAGTSTGLNVAAALGVAKQLGPGKCVFTVACDSGMKYLNAGLFD